MGESEQDTDQKTKLADEVRLYIEKRIQYVSIIISEQVSLVFAESFQKLIGLLLLSSAFLFLWLALAFFLGDVLNNTGLGFLIAALPLFLFGFIFSRTKSKKITERIQAELIGKVMDSVDESLQSTKTNQEDSSEEK